MIKQQNGITMQEPKERVCPIMAFENAKASAEKVEPTVYTNARLKIYPQKVMEQVASQPIFLKTPGKSQPRGYEVPPAGQAKNPERASQESRRRAVASIRDMALCNQFEYFFTWTLDPALINRYDEKTLLEKLRAFLSNSVQRKGFAYVAVPEYHKLKPGESTPAIHIHGLCKLGNIPIERAISPRSGKPLSDRSGRPVFNMLTWTYGFSACVLIDAQYERAVNYVTKYIGKSDSKIFGKWYLHSRGLVKGPEIIPVEDIPYWEFRDDYKLNVHEQNECEIYPGLRILIEDLST